MAPPLLRVSGLTLGYRGAPEAVRDVSFDVEPGEVLAIVGPSGVGKSTLLAGLAGLLRPRRGTIETANGLLASPTPRHAVVFQDGALFPWLTLEKNVLYALQRKGVSRVAGLKRATELLRRVGLGGHGDKFPHELSGGMKKRGAFARALATDPALLLLDEPFSALDVTTRAELHKQLLSLFSDRGIGVVIVTHELDEAAVLADRVLVLGGTPGEIIGEIAIASPRPRTVSDLALAATRTVLAREVARAATTRREEDGDETRATHGARALALGAGVASAR